MLNIINTWASMKGCSGVFTGGQLLVFWFITFFFAHPISSVSSLEVTWRRFQGQPRNYCSTSGGRASATEASSPSPSGPLGDETVRLAKPASTPVASPPVSRSSSSWETGLAGGETTPSSSTSMAWP